MESVLLPIFSWPPGVLAAAPISDRAGEFGLNPSPDRKVSVVQKYFPAVIENLRSSNSCRPLVDWAPLPDQSTSCNLIVAFQHSNGQKV